MSNLTGRLLSIRAVVDDFFLCFLFVEIFVNDNMFSNFRYKKKQNNTVLTTYQQYVHFTFCGF